MANQPFSKSTTSHDKEVHYIQYADPPTLVSNWDYRPYAITIFTRETTILSFHNTNQVEVALLNLLTLQNTKLIFEHHNYCRCNSFEWLMQEFTSHMTVWSYHAGRLKTQQMIINQMQSCFPHHQIVNVIASHTKKQNVDFFYSSVSSNNTCMQT